MPDRLAEGVAKLQSKTKETVIAKTYKTKQNKNNKTKQNKKKTLLIHHMTSHNI